MAQRKKNGTKKNRIKRSNGNFISDASPLPSHWAMFATKSLLHATRAIDRLCHQIVKTKRSRWSSITELRRIALTVAVFERSLFAYAHRIKLLQRRKKEHEKAIRLRQNSQTIEVVRNFTIDSNSTDVSLSIPPSFPIRGSSTSLTQTVVDGLPDGYTSQEGILAQSVSSRSILSHASGGMVSLLQLLASTLDACRHSIKSLPYRSFFYYLQHTRSWLMIPLCFIFQSRITNVSKKMVQNLSKSQRPFIRVFMSYVKPYFRSHYIALVSCILVYGMYLNDCRSRTIQLKKHHAQLGILLRLWPICVSALDDKESNQNHSEIGHSPKVTQRRSSDNDSVPISQWMLELVPPSLDSSFWYQRQDLYLLKHLLDIMYSGYSHWYYIFGNTIIGLPFAFFFFLYYVLVPGKAAKRCSALIGRPDIKFIRFTWRMHDRVGIPKILWNLEQLKTFAGLSPKLAVLKEINLIVEKEKNDYDSSAKVETKNRNYTDNNRKYIIKLMVISAKPLNIAINNTFCHTQSPQCIQNLKGNESPIIIYLHGGACLAEFRNSKLLHLKKWAIMTNVPILFVNYSLTPEKAYPTALNECYDVFKWVAQGVGLGVKPSKIILVGDDAGGNLAVGTCLRCIANKDERKPDALVLAYPILNLSQTSTPSRSLFMGDAIIPMNLLLQCRSAYIPSHYEPDWNPFLSSVTASDHRLSKFPPISIMVGSFDPFLDDSIDFAHQLYLNNIECKLHVFKALPHFFLDFAPYSKKSNEAVKVLGQWLKSYCSIASMSV